MATEFTLGSVESYKVKLQSMDEILHQISCMDQAESEEDLHLMIAPLLRAVGKYTRADRVYIFDWVTEEHDSLGNTFEWCEEGVQAEIDNLKAVPIHFMPRWMEKLNAREPIVINDLEQVREYMPQEYEFLKKQDIHSLIAVPIYSNRAMNGFIGVDNPDLSQDEISINLLSDVGGHLGCVRESLKNVKKLKEALKRVTKGSEIISSLATLYTTIFYGNIAERSYELLDGEKLMYEIAGKKGYLEEHIDEILSTFIVPEKREEMREFLNIDTLAERLQNTNSVMIEFKGTNDKWRRARFVVKSRNSEGIVTEVLYVARDITEEKKQEREYEDQLKRSAEEAERASRSKTMFLRRMSHDIRTPLNGIVGMIHIAEKHNDNIDKLKECRQKVLHSTEYLQDLINNVLDISKLESGSLVLENKPFDLIELLNKQMTVAETNAYENGIQFEEEVEWETIQHRYLNGSPLYLNRVLMNLASNAIKYNRFRGKVKVRCTELSSTEDTALFEFVCSDNGLGMSEEFQKHAFEPFTQEGKETTTSFSGSGLGLSIVKDIIELMGGTILLESRENVGTRFTVRIPFEIDYTLEAQSQDRNQKDTINLKGYTALLVEDNELNMEIARTMLEDEGVNIIEAKNGKEAVEVFKNSALNTFDLIFMDIMMPVMDGLEATKQIKRLDRQDAQTVPIIAMTANAFEEDKKECIAAGMNEHIAKPLESQVLLKTISKYIK